MKLSTSRKLKENSTGNGLLFVTSNKIIAGVLGSAESVDPNFTSIDAGSGLFSLSSSFRAACFISKTI